MFYLVGIVIIFFLALILLSKKNKSEADSILVIWFFFIGIHLSLYYWHSTGNYIHFPYLLGIELPLPLVHGPFLYLYTASLTRQVQNKRSSWLHFLPALLTYGYFAPFYLSSSLEKIEVYKNEGMVYQRALEMVLLAIIVSGIGYVVAASLLIIDHKKNISDQFSYTEKINLDWLKYLIVGIGVIWVTIIFGEDTLTFSSIVLFVIFIGYFGINQVGIFTQTNISPNKETHGFNADFRNHVAMNSTPETESKEVKSQSNLVKYEKSSLTETQISQIHFQLDRLMSEDKIFKDPELTLFSLAQQMGVHPNNLSQVINSVENKNFYDYINTFRIEEFKNMVFLPENQKYTLLSLAFDCGFNSKTSFNRNFKKVTNLSPSEFLSQAKVNLK